MAVMRYRDPPPPVSNYRGWRSTKLHLALITMGLATFAFGLAGAPDALFGEYCMALAAAGGVYSTSSAAEKFAKPKVDDPG